MAVIRFWRRFAVAALWLTVLAGALDAGFTALMQPGRVFSIGLPAQSICAHVALGLALSFAVAAAYRILPRRARLRITRLDPFRIGFALIVAAYFVLFVGFYYYVDLVDDPRQLRKLLSYPAISYGVLLLLATVMLGRWSYRFLTPGTRRSGIAGQARIPAIRVAAVTLLLGGLASGTLLSGRVGFEFAGARVRLDRSTLNRRERLDGSAFKNAILIVMDTTRRDRLSVYGHDLPTTPCLERLAAEGTVFTEASSAASYTLTSHASILTGQLPSRHRATSRSGRLGPECTSLADVLGRAGLRTGAFVATRVLRRESGIARGFDHYDDMVDPELCHTFLWDIVHNLQATAAQVWKPLRGDGQPHWIEDHQRSAEDQNVRILTWLDEGGDDPFFLFVNYYDPHWPYVPPAEFRKKFEIPYEGPITGYLFRDDDFPDGYRLTDDDHRYLLSLYDAEIAYLDREIGRLLDTLEERGILDETLVLITADHGEYFGEHGHYSHKELYEEAIGVPLILRLPGAVPAGRRINTPVQLPDIVPTLLELAGLEVPSDVQGTSLVSLMRETASAGTAWKAADRRVLAEDYDGGGIVRKMARVGPMKYIVSHDGISNEELFDLDADRMESVNLLPQAGDQPPPGRITEILSRLRGYLDALEKEPDRGEAETVTSPTLDRRQREALKVLGYIE